MTGFHRRRSQVGGETATYRIASFVHARQGGIAIATAIALPILLAALGLGSEVGYWYMERQAMQNAADSAVVSAASNGGASYGVEAKAVAASYGFVHGSDNVVVAVTNAAACPGGGSTCYRVTIDKAMPLYLSRMVGYTGNTRINGERMQNLSSTATAKKSLVQRRYCVLSLASSGAYNGIRTNGSPDADLPGCDLMSNTNATCNGHDLNADIGDAAGINNGCGNEQHSHMPVVPDPYFGRAANIPADTCAGNYPQISGGTLPVSNLWVGDKVLSGNVIVCGDLRLSGNVTVNAPAGAVLVIVNGQLDTNGFTLRSSSGSGLTIVFSGSNGSYIHAPTGAGRLDFAAPITGPWKGVAIYQAPALTSGVDISAAGNTPTWDITGLVYTPHAAINLRGVVNKASHGYSCFGIVADTVVFSGTTAILAHGQCNEAGLQLPYNMVFGRGELVD